MCRNAYSSANPWPAESGVDGRLASLDVLKVASWLL
jgi:hypothetical protein